MRYNSIHYIHSVFLFLAAVTLLAGCQKNETDHPPLNELAEVITLAELRDLFTGTPVTFTEPVSVFATVTMDESTGNIYRAVYVQDHSAAINVRLDFASNVAVGDSVRLSLKGTTLSSFNNMLQLDSVKYGKHFIRHGKGQTVEPVIVSIPDILAGGYQARLVRLQDVQFSAGALGRSFANAIDQITENRDLQDCFGNRIIVRTSGFADFAAQHVPEGNGELVAIASQFGNVWQLLIRHPDELIMEGERCDSDDPVGSGSFDDPFNVAAAVSNNSGDNVWVEGYIIGVMETTADPFAPAWTPPFSTNSNIIIADQAEERNLGNALIVQLPVGEVRNALNLVQHSGNLGKQVKIMGDLSTYFGQAGMRNARGYYMDGEGIVPQTGFYEEKFSSSLSNYSTHNILGEQNWVHSTFDGGNAYMNGYADGSNRANENWLISPQISLTGRNNVKLHIREALNYLTSHSDVKVMVASNYQGGNPNDSGSWVELSGFNRPPGNSWTFVNSGGIDISNFDGQSIHIAFKYISTTAGASAWQVSEINLTESNR
jgi:hypothetical protein